MDKNKATALLEKYKNNSLNEKEKYLLENWYAELEKKSTLNLESGELIKNLDRIWKEINLNTAPVKVLTVPKQKRFVLWKKGIAAAAVLFIILVGGVLYYSLNQQEKDQDMHFKQLAKAIKPGGNKAVLTLSNGQTIILDHAMDGKIAEQAGITITKAKDGQLIYTASANHQTAKKSLINTITTPKGGQYQIHLPDGSKVWLNAQSSLRYPTFFNEKERLVTLTGEAYFEVAKSNAQQPFKVLTENQTVEVLGTQFNINSYADELDVKTTLVEGSVKVVSNLTENNPAAMVILKPGQQSSLISNRFAIDFVNTDQFTAWKNGMFVFKDANLKTMMRTLSRWYDIDIVYEGKLPNQEFSGDIYRNLNLDQILEVFSFYKVRFKIEGKKLIVTP